MSLFEISVVPLLGYFINVGCPDENIYQVKKFTESFNYQGVLHDFNNLRAMLLKLFLGLSPKLTFSFPEDELDYNCESLQS